LYWLIDVQAVTSPEVRCRLAGRTGASVAVALLLLADLLLPDRPVGFVYVPQPSEKRAREAANAPGLGERSPCHSSGEGGGCYTDAVVRSDSDRTRAPTPTSGLSRETMT
jgi:hypothetical protein